MDVKPEELKNLADKISFYGRGAAEDSEFSMTLTGRHLYVIEHALRLIARPCENCEDHVARIKYLEKELARVEDVCDRMERERDREIW